MLSAEALSFRQQSRLAISLSWVGGFTNVIALLTWQTFASHMTGASTYLGFNMADGNWTEVGLFALLLAAFVAGATLSALLTETARRRGSRSRYTFPLTLEALLLTLLMIALRLLHDPAANPWRFLLLALTALAMGLQNATITKISGAVVRSTHVTGVLTDLGIETVHFALFAWDSFCGRTPPTTGRHPALLRIALLASIWGSFTCGALIGAAAYLRFGPLVLAAPILFLVAVILLSRRKIARAPAVPVMQTAAVPAAADAHPPTRASAGS